MNSYRTINQESITEINIKKSRFIASVKSVATEEAALAFIEMVRQEHKNATHNVYAYSIGIEREMQRLSDDGEPSGTAGKPILEVVKKEKIKNIVIVVTRYFGGIKLGAGGLIRAYGQTAKAGIEASEMVNMEKYQEITITVDYPIWGSVQRELENGGQVIKGMNYSDKVEVKVFVKIDDVLHMKKRLVDLTNDNVLFKIGLQLFLPEGV